MPEPTYTEGSESTTNSYTKPTASTGDWLIIFHDMRADATRSMSPPSGWTEVYYVPLGSATIFAGCYIRKVDGTEGAGPYSVTEGGSGTIYGTFGSIGVLAGADGTTPVDDTDTNGATGSSTTASTGAVVDATNTDSIGFFHLATDGGATAGNPTAQFGGTVTQLFSLDGGDSELWVETGTASGGTGKTYSHSWSGTRAWACGYVTMKAAVVAGHPIWIRGRGVPQLRIASVARKYVR